MSCDREGVMAIRRSIPILAAVPGSVQITIESEFPLSTSCL